MVRKEGGKTDSGQMRAPDFGEFVKFFNEEMPRMHFLQHKGYHLPASIGFMSYIYIWYFFKEPVKVLSKNDEELIEYFQSGRYRQDMSRVYFLRTEHLNSDLHDFLLSKGFDRETLHFILKMQKINARISVNPETYFTPKLADYVKEKNWIYYRYFWCDGSVGPLEHSA